MKSNYKIHLSVLSVLLFLTGSFCFSQNFTADTIQLRAYYNICQNYELSSADSVLKYADLQLKLATKINYPTQIIRAHIYFGIAYVRLFKFNNALTHYLKARELVEKRNTGELSPLLGQIGYIYLRLNRKSEAYKYFKQQQSISILEKNYEGYLNCVVNLADYYNTNNSLDSSINLLQQGLKIARKYKFRSNEVVIIDNIANAYYAKAIDSDDRSYFKLVEQYADSALTLHFEDKDSSAIFYIYGLLGALNKDLKNYKKSEDYYNQYVSYSQRTKDIVNLKIAIDEMSLLFADQGKFNKAYQYRLMYDSINRLYMDEEAHRQVSELNTKYETEKKEEQNALLIKKDELSTKTINQQKTINAFIIISLVVSILFGIFMFRIYRQKKNAHILISKQKEEVEQKQVEIEFQKGVIEEKQTEIVDSINYAKRIQYALLPTDKILAANLREHFILFKPKDIVSGDFYWATEHNDSFYMAVCDSTGHGVPGAFMSLLNIGFLSEAIKEKNILAPNEILNYVRERLIENISQDGGQDGMDCILVKIEFASSFNKDRSVKRITYSAANNAPILISNNEMHELQKDKMPVGKGLKTTSFTLHEIKDFKNEETLYLYTDGYADQFGGPEAKKFKSRRLNELLLSICNKPFNEQQNMLNTEFISWKGPLEQIDDVCVIGIKI